MERAEAGEPGGTGWSEDEELSESGPEANSGPVGTAGPPSGATGGDAPSGSGEAVHPSGTGWSEQGDSAEPPPDDIVSTGTTEVEPGANG